MLSSIHHRILPLLILCSLLLALPLLLAGCSTLNKVESVLKDAVLDKYSKDAVLDKYSDAIYHFRREIRRPLTKEAVNSYEWADRGKAPLTLEEVMASLKYTADHSSDKTYLLVDPMGLNYLKEWLEKWRADSNIAGVYPDVDKAVDDLLSTIDAFDSNAEIWAQYYANYDAVKQKYGTNGTKKLDEFLKYMEGEIKQNYEEFSNASYQLFNIIYSHRMELRDYYLNGDTSRKSGPFFDLEHQIDALHYMQDEMPLDQTVVEKKIDEINKTMEKLPKDEELENYRKAINRYTRAFRSYTTGKITQEELARAYRALQETPIRPSPPKK